MGAILAPSLAIPEEQIAIGASDEYPQKMPARPAPGLA
jgi:hypothetical protein